MDTPELDPTIIGKLRVSITDGHMYCVTLEPDGQHLVVWRSGGKMQPYGKRQ